MFAIVVPLLIYWLVIFVVCFAIMEVAQDQLYDEVTPHAGLKVTVGSLALAGMATWLRPSFETLLTTNIVWTLLSAVVWFLVFLFVFQFHPPHALFLSLPTMIMVTGLATMGVDSMTKPTPTLAPVNAKGAPPVRKSLTPSEPPPTPPAKAQTK